MWRDKRAAVGWGCGRQRRWSMNRAVRNHDKRLRLKPWSYGINFSCILCQSRRTIFSQADVDESNCQNRRRGELYAGWLFQVDLSRAGRQLSRAEIHAAVLLFFLLPTEQYWNIEAHFCNIRRLLDSWHQNGHCSSGPSGVGAGCELLGTQELLQGAIPDDGDSGCMCAGCWYAWLWTVRRMLGGNVQLRSILAYVTYIKSIDALPHLHQPISSISHDIIQGTTSPDLPIKRSPLSIQLQTSISQLRSQQQCIPNQPFGSPILDSTSHWPHPRLSSSRLYSPRCMPTFRSPNHQTIFALMRRPPWSTLSGGSTGTPTAETTGLRSTTQFMTSRAARRA